MNGHDLKRRRLAIGISQAALGKAAGIAQPHISQMEAGRRAIGPKTRHRLEWALCPLELERSAVRARMRACVDRVMARPDMVALRAEYAKMNIETN